MKYATWLASLALPLLIALPLRVATAQSDAAAELELPGLQSDADAFAAKLQQAYPGGASKQQMQRANDAAEAAVQSNDWQKALPALETMVGGVGQDSTADWQTWLALGVAEAKVNPPQPEKSLQAAWMAFTLVDESSSTAAADQVTALQLMDAALTALKQPLPEVEVLQAIARRLPGDHAAQQAAVQRLQQVGLLFKGVATDAESFPARACLSFLGNPSSSPDFHASDWVKLDPAPKDAAVTLESRQICVAGLPAGDTTTVTILHGMPGDDGISLHQDLVVPVAMPDRQPRLVFDGARYIQPRDGAATVALDVVNLSAVHLTLVKIAERNLLHVMQTYPPGSDALGLMRRPTSNRIKAQWFGRGAPRFRASFATRSITSCCRCRKLSRSRDCTPFSRHRATGHPSRMVPRPVPCNSCCEPISRRPSGMERRATRSRSAAMRAACRLAEPRSTFWRLITKSSHRRRRTMMASRISRNPCSRARTVSRPRHCIFAARMGISRGWI